ncbi:MAG: hypothetical protein HYT70_00560 [Candidatus Aenigmarchaeota archaeon]|nr:hypothetical protein [Candidatus Aenigmarchaeota archaeon]
MPRCRICDVEYTDPRIHRELAHPDRDVKDITGSTYEVIARVPPGLLGGGDRRGDREEREPPSGIIKGKVTDSKTGQPLSEVAYIQADSPYVSRPFNVPTDQDSSYQITVPTRGGGIEYSVIATADFYKKPRPRVVRVAPGQTVNNVDFSLEPDEEALKKHGEETKAKKEEERKQRGEKASIWQRGWWSRERLLIGGGAFIITALTYAIFYRPIILEGLGFDDPSAPPWWILTVFVPIAFFFAVYNLIPRDIKDIRPIVIGAIAAGVTFLLLQIGPLSTIRSPTIQFGIPLIVFFVVAYVAQNNLQQPGGVGRTILWLTGIFAVIGVGFYVLNLFTTGAFLNIETYLQPLNVLTVVGVPQETVDGMKQGIRDVLKFLNVQAIKPLKPEVKKSGGFEAIQLNFGSKFNDYRLPTLFARMEYLLPVTIINPNKIETGVEPVKGFYIDEVYIINGSTDKVICGVAPLPLKVETAKQESPIFSGRVDVGDILPQEEKSLTILFTGRSPKITDEGKYVNCSYTASFGKTYSFTPLAPVRVKESPSGENSVIKACEKAQNKRECYTSQCKSYCQGVMQTSNGRYGVHNKLDEPATRYIENTNECECKIKRLDNVMDDLCFMSGNKAKLELKAHYNFFVEGKGELVVAQQEADQKLVPKPRVTSSLGPLTVTAYFVPDIYVVERNAGVVTLFVDIANDGEGSATINDYEIKDFDTRTCVPTTPLSADAKASTTIVCDATAFAKGAKLQGRFTTLPLIVDVNYSYSQKYTKDLNVEKKSISDIVTEGSDEYIDLDRQFSPLPYYCERGLNIYGSGGQAISVAPVTQPTAPSSCDGCTLPIKDTSILPSESARISYCNSRPQSSACDTATWNRVVKRAQELGLNPALIVSLWGEESGFSDALVQYSAALGCDPYHTVGYDKEIDDQLNCVSDLVNKGSYLNCGGTEFCSFAKWYSAGPACTLTNNPNFYGNLAKIYNDFVQAGKGALTCQVTTTPTTVAKGSLDFCAQKIKDGLGECVVGQGGCVNNNECSPNEFGPTGGGLECRNVGVRVNVCCYKDESNDRCKSLFEEWLKST